MSPHSPGKPRSSKAPPSPASLTPPTTASDPPVPTGDSPDPDAAKAAFEQVLAQLRAHPRDQVKNNRSYLQGASLYAYGVAPRPTAAGLCAQFAALPSDLFDIAYFDRLETVAAVAWYAHVQFDSAMTTTTEAVEIRRYL